MDTPSTSSCAWSACQWLTPRAAFSLTGLLVATALLLAYIAEYGFGLAPCELCLWQRIPFYGILGLYCLGTLLPLLRRHYKALLGCISLLLAANTGLASYHTGVEQGWWPGPTHCSGDEIQSFDTVEALRQHILNAPLVRCDKPALEVFGITMASANAAFCLLLLIYTSYALISNTRTEKDGANA